MTFRAFTEYASLKGLSAQVEVEDQNSDYESGLAKFEGETWHIRTARITPTKVGGFVAFWHRNSKGDTEPFSNDDPANGLLVFVADNGHRGLFQFTNKDLARLGITSGPRAGKRGFRVYPPWVKGLHGQASKTQMAQMPAFIEY